VCIAAHRAPSQVMNSYRSTGPACRLVVPRSRSSLQEKTGRKERIGGEESSGSAMHTTQATACGVWQQQFLSAG
jgi:hypothetical protein